jgi:hypothetical protein
VVPALVLLGRSQISSLSRLFQNFSFETASLNRILEYGVKKLKVLIGSGVFSLMLAGCAVSMGEDFVLPMSGRNGGAEYGAYVTEYNLETYVPLPYTGEVPVVQVTHRGDLEASIIWKNAGGSVVNINRFEEGVVYRAEIKITPKNGYLFYSAQMFIYRAGRVTAQEDDGGVSERTIMVTYKPAQERSEDEGLGFEFNWPGLQ